MSPTVDQDQQSIKLDGITPYLLMVFLGCWLGGLFDGMDSSLYMVIQHDAIAEVAHTMDRGVISHLGSIIMSTFLFGWMAGGILFGMIGDRYGRVTAMLFSILLYALFTGTAGFAHTAGQLALCRFLTGVGIGGEMVTITTMLSEVWPEKSRALAVGMVITSYQAGVFLAGLIPTWVYPHFEHSAWSPWRIVFFAGALPALLAILIRLRLEEPERWQKSRALATASESAGVDETFLGGLLSSFKRIFVAENSWNLFVGGLAFGGLLVGYWASLAWIPTWIQDLIGPNGHGTEKSVATMYHGIAAVLGCITSGLLADSLGRKGTMAIGYLGMFAATALLLLTNHHFSTTIYWEDALLGFFSGVTQAIMYIYLPELFPTPIRATCVGFCLNVGRFATAIAVLFVGTLVGLLGGYAQALMVFTSCYLIALVATVFGQETRGQILPD